MELLLRQLAQDGWHVELHCDSTGVSAHAVRDDAAGRLVSWARTPVAAALVLVEHAAHAKSR